MFALFAFGIWRIRLTGCLDSWLADVAMHASERNEPAGRGCVGWQKQFDVSQSDGCPSFDSFRNAYLRRRHAIKLGAEAFEACGTKPFPTELRWVNLSDDHSSNIHMSCGLLGCCGGVQRIDELTEAQGQMGSVSRESTDECGRLGNDGFFFFC